MIDVTVSTVIAAPPAAVAAVMFDPRRDPQWIGGAARAKPLSAMPVHVGSRVRREGAFLGRPIAWVTEVAEIEADRRLVMRVLEGPFVGGEVTYEIEAQGQGSRVSIRNRGKGWLPGMGLMVRASVKADLKRLKAIVEAESV